MRRGHVLTLALVAAIAAACQGLGTRPTPYPSIEAPDGVPSTVIDAARAHVQQHAVGPVVVRGAFAVRLADYVITEADERGWGVLFTVTTGDDETHDLLVILNAELIFMQSQERAPAP